MSSNSFNMNPSTQASTGWVAQWEAWANNEEKPSEVSSRADSVISSSPSLSTSSSSSFTIDSFPSQSLSSKSTSSSLQERNIEMIALPKSTVSLEKPLSSTLPSTGVIVEELGSNGQVIETLHQIPVPQVEPSTQPRYTAKGMIANNVLAAIVLVAQATLNGAFGSEGFGSKSSGNGADLLIHTAATSFLAKAEKAPWREQASIKAQLGVITGFTSAALALDLLTSYCFNKGSLVGKMTLLQAMVASGLITKMVAAGFLGKHTYVQGNKSTPPVTSENMRRAFCFGYIGLLSLTNAFICKFTSPTTSLSVISNLFFSTSFGKVEKTLIKAQDTKSKRWWMIGIGSMIGILSAMTVGFAMPRDDKEATTQWGILFNFLYDKFGPTTAMVIAQVLCNLVFRVNKGLEKDSSKKDIKSKQVTNMLEQGKAKKEVKAISPVEKKHQPPTTKALVQYGALTTVTNAAASVAHLVIQNVFGGSGTADLVVKQFQTGFVFHQVKHATIGMTSAVKQALYCLGMLGLALATELPCYLSRDDSESNILFASTVAIFIGNALFALLGKYARNDLVPKPGFKKC